MRPPSAPNICLMPALPCTWVQSRRAARAIIRLRVAGKLCMPGKAALAVDRLRANHGTVEIQPRTEYRVTRGACRDGTIRA